ncbi:MAG: hypothetical protein ACQETH_11420 [Candidatus Rifleibacteriota bacterium]
MLRKVVFALSCFLFFAPLCYGQNAFNQLLETYEQSCEIELELKEKEYERRDAIIEFLEPHTGSNYVKNNLRHLARIAVRPHSENYIDNILENYISDDDRRKEILKELDLPEISSSLIRDFDYQLKNLIEPLRCPQIDGYRYAHYSRDEARSVYEQKLVAKHAIGSFQTYERFFNDQIFKVRIYSPTKRGLFKMNRDVYLNRLTVDYEVDGQTKQSVKDFKRFLKRGENLEFNLTEIADNATIKLTYATKPEHRNKAYFVVEPFAAELIDDPDSPFKSLISHIDEEKYKKDGISNKLASVQILKAGLKDAMLNFHNQESLETHSKKTSQTSVEKTKANKDDIQYFIYMLRDENNSREKLENKFKQLFN